MRLNSISSSPRRYVGHARLWRSPSWLPALAEAELPELPALGGGDALGELPRGHAGLERLADLLKYEKKRDMRCVVLVHFDVRWG